MNKQLTFRKSSLLFALFLFASFQLIAQNFSVSSLQGENLNSPTSLQFGPDGRLGGFRNIYDLVWTQDNRLYTWDNGPNGGWGGHPDNEGFGTATNNSFSKSAG